MTTADPVERARGQACVQAAEHDFAESMLVYEEAAARVFAAVMAGALRRGRSSRARFGGHHIAAIAIAIGLALSTINVADLAGIDGFDGRSVTAPC